jgi:hypothetical protein
VGLRVDVASYDATTDNRALLVARRMASSETLVVVLPANFTIWGGRGQLELELPDSADFGFLTLRALDGSGAMVSLSSEFPQGRRVVVRRDDGDVSIDAQIVRRFPPKPRP